MPVSNTILELHKVANEVDDYNSLYGKISPLLDYKAHYQTHESLIPLTPVDYYLGVLENIYEADFELYSELKKKEILNQLLHIYAALINQQFFEKKHQKVENQKRYDTYLKHCEKLIDRLRSDDNGTPYESKYLAPNEGQCHTIKYVFIGLGKQFSEFMVGIYNRQTKTLFDIIGFVNEKRLYWVWSSVLLKTVVGLIPKDFRNVDEAGKALRAPDPYTGALSWALYYFRFSINLGLVLKHTIAGPWMSEAEKKIPWTERFRQQWEQRWTVLLNDFLWATCNLVCYFWLQGTGADGFTFALLIFDIIATGINHEKQKTRYNKEISGYDSSILDLESQILAAAGNDTKILTQILTKSEYYDASILNQILAKAEYDDTPALGQILADANNNALISKEAWEQAFNNALISNELWEEAGGGAFISKAILKNAYDSALISKETWEKACNDALISKEVWEKACTDALISKEIMNRTYASYYDGLALKLILSETGYEAFALKSHLVTADDNASGLRPTLKKVGDTPLVQDLLKQLATIKDAKEQCTAAWKKKEFDSTLAMVYACSLAVAFLILTLPLTGVPGIVVATIGAILCFTLNLVFSTIRSGTELHACKQTKISIEAEYLAKLEKFGTLKGILPKDDNQLKLLYMEIRRLEARTDHQKQMWTYQILQFLRTVFIETLTPLIVFASFVFLSTGAGIGIVAGYLVLAGILNLALEKGVKPGEVEKIGFDDDEYDSFYDQPRKMKAPKGSNQFFGAKEITILPDDDSGSELQP